jgi:curli biogenesis system outer membrane secretion channel CsgG
MSFFLTCLLAIALSVPVSASHAAQETSATVKGGWLVAVFPLENLAASEDTKGLGEEIAATLTDGFGRSGKVRVVERARLEKIMEELKLGTSGLTDEQSVIRAGRLLGANALVLGSVLKFGDSLKINVRVVKTETGEILSTGKVAGKFSRLPDLEEKLMTVLLPRLHSQIP